MPDRIPCIVPFCGRTARADRYPAGAEIICPVHWRGVPVRTKAIYRRACAAERRAGAVDEAAYARLVMTPACYALPETDPVVHDRLVAAWKSVLATRRARRLWRTIRRRVIEAAGGIG